MKKTVLTLALLLGLSGIYFLSSQYFSSNFGRVQYPTLKQTSLQQTPGCSGLNKLSTLRIQIDQIDAINHRGLRAVLVPEETCVRRGDVEVALGYTPRNSGLRIYEVLEVKARVVQILKVDEEIPSDYPKLLGMTSIQEVRDLVASRKSILNEPLYFVRFDLPSPIHRKFDRALLTRRNDVKAISLTEAVALQKRGAVWIDLRSKEEFAKNPNPLAVNIPYLLAQKNDERTFLPVSEFQNSDKFDRSAVIKRTEGELIFSGADVLDIRVVRAMALTVPDLPKKKLYWFRDGDAGRRGESPETPSTVPVQAVSAKEALALKKKGAVFIEANPMFTRPFMESGIAGAKAIPFQGSDSRCPLSHLTRAEMRRKKENFNTGRLPQSKDVILVIYGNDQFDWAALKAAIWSKEEGWKKTYWLRGGAAEWLAENEMNPSDFTLQAPGMN